MKGINIVLTLTLLLFIIFFKKPCNKVEKYVDVYSNLNYVSKILWINLDRSPERRSYMERLLELCNVDNERVSGVDGTNVDVFSILEKLKKPLFQKLENDEITYRSMKTSEAGCTLSHIKAINSLYNEKGKYFLICEDDISLENLVYFSNTSLEKIIKNAPDFEILTLNKIMNRSLKNEYTLWDKKLEVYGTACYIITKNGIDKITNLCKYDYDNKFKFNINEKDDFNVADIYLYEILNTWIYKFNYVNTLDQTSTIHDDHLDFHKISTKANLHLIKYNQNYL